MNNFILYLKSHWYKLILFCFILYIYDTLLLNCVYCMAMGCGIECNFLVYVLNLCTYFTPEMYTMAFFILFICSKYFTNFVLYFYSYHVYVGKNNWYKFYNELAKKHKHDDRLLYRDYINGKFDINDIR